MVIEYGVDAISLTEVNNDWRLVKHNNTIWHGTMGYKEHSRVQVSQNIITFCTFQFQVGFTATMVFDNIVFIITAQGQDERKLGRWT